MQAESRESEPAERSPAEAPPAPVSAMERIEHSANRVARLEKLRSGYQDAVIRRESRRTAAEISERDSRIAHDHEAAGQESAELEAWIVDEAAAMMREGWTSAQLADFGFAPEVLEQAALRAAHPPE